MNMTYFINYFVVPYGALILALPFILWFGASNAGFVRSSLASGLHSYLDWEERLLFPNGFSDAPLTF